MVPANTGTGRADHLPLQDVQSYRIEVLYASPDMNLVSEIRYGKFNGRDTAELLIISEDGYRLMSTSGKVAKTRRFSNVGPERVAYAKMVGAAATAPSAFVGSRGGNTIAVYDWSGQLLWGRTTEPWTIPFSADLHGNGSYQIIVPERSHGVLAYSRDGTVSQFLTRESCLNATAVDFGAAADAKIAMQVQKPGKLAEILVIDGNGRSIARWSPEFKFYEFTAAASAGGEMAGRLVFLDRTERNARFVTTDIFGKSAIAYQAPSGEQFAVPHACLLGDGVRDKSMVVLASSTGGAHRFGVFLYGKDAEMLYRYIGQEDADSILVLPTEACKKNPYFVIGARNRVLKFEPA